MKYTLLLISFFIFFNYSCKESSNKEIQTDTISKITSEKKKETQKSNYENFCKVTVEEKDIVLDCGKKIIYSGLIVDEMSVSTEFIQGENNTFSLLYEFNASATKMKEKYDFVYSNGGLMLLSKEILKFGREGISLHKVYFKKYAMNFKSFDDLQSLASDIKDDFNQNPVSSLYGSQKKLFGKEMYHSSNEDFYVNYPKSEHSNLEITNVEIANNQAFDLQNENAHTLSKFILEKIIEKDPNRVVVWINLGDVYWSLNEKSKAKDAYRKYISLMKSQNKNISKIPKRVYDRSK